MIPEIGEFSLVLALCLALVQSIFPLLGTYYGKASWMALARPSAFGQFTFLAFSFLCLIAVFILNDFSVVYVAENSNTHLPWFYRIPAVWGAHEGSLLLWVTILGFWTAAVAFWGKKLPADIISRVIGVLGLISVGFIWFTLATSSPFQRILPDFPMDGQDLNPILQDPGLIFHPPMLYMGYVGFAVAFAFAITALLSGRVDTNWARWTRPWTLIAWCFLTTGITLGSWWSYRELGWGGWWFWDPVENASLMPWLVGTALLHSLTVTEKRGIFKSWTILLAICAFSLSLLGTFLVRSGVLNSVHSFASDPTRGIFMLRFLCVVIGGSLLLFAWRAPLLKGNLYFGFLSRESFLLWNNILLVVMMFTVLLGTLYPLILDALTGEKISVGPPYFNTVIIPIAAMMFLGMCIGPLCRWQQTPSQQLLKHIIGCGMIAFLVGITLPWLMTGVLSWQVVFALTAACWISFTVMTELWLHNKMLSKTNNKINKAMSRRQLAMVFAHCGVAICIIGIAISSVFSVEKNVAMAPGNSTQVGPYQFKFINVIDMQGPNYSGAAANFQITRNDKLIAFLTAQNRIYTVQQVAMTEAAVKAGIFRDLYIALGEPLQGDAWGIRLYYKPFVRWIWLGGLLMLMGGLISLSDRTYGKRAMHR